MRCYLRSSVRECVYFEINSLLNNLRVELWIRRQPIRQVVIGSSLPHVVAVFFGQFILKMITANIKWI